jgi:hypothetical protein
MAASKLPEFSVDVAGTYVVLPKDELARSAFQPETKISDFLDLKNDITALDFIRLYRECRGETLTFLSDKIEMDPQHLQKVEKGILPLTKKTEAKLSNYWGEKFKKGLAYVRSLGEKTRAIKGP